MENFKRILEDVIKNKTKLKIFLSVELVIFTILVSILTITIINKNKVIETAEIENIEIEQNEIPEIVEEVIEEEEPAQELTEEEQEEAEKEENIANKEDEKNQNKNDSNSAPSGYGTTYYIKVNYGANVVTVYTKDAEGNYTVPVKAMVCSTGRATPRSGVYKLKSVKHRWGALFGGVWGQYTTQIVGNILFHSVPYLSANPSNLEYWEYDKLGTTASAGCVRLRVCDAKWIYDCMPAGTPVEFYSDSNPGPLGKPGAQRISGNEAYRGWDPTDPDGNNPWRNVVQTPEPTPAPVQEQAPVQQTQNNQQENKTTTVEVKNETETQPEQKPNEETKQDEQEKEQTENNNNNDNLQNEEEKGKSEDKENNDTEKTQEIETTEGNNEE